jgi:signal peptidase II
MARTQDRLVAVALGLLIGGALGNALDRVVHGAVADFFLLWWIPFFPYVFNVADSAIVAGVALLLYDSLVVDRRRPTAAARGGAEPPT